MSDDLLWPTCMTPYNASWNSECVYNLILLQSDLNLEFFDLIYKVCDCFIPEK